MVFQLSVQVATSYKDVSFLFQKCSVDLQNTDI